MKNWKRKILSDVCKLSSDRININKLSVKNYISTENLLQNKGGKVDASALPSAGQVVAFSPKMTLVSNIRPYFRKIYFSDSYGGCSNDVLAFIAKEGVSEKWLYYLLSQDAFFDYVMSGAKGTKMPRGDKTQIMNFPLYLPPFPEQVKMAHILDAIDEKISASNKINQNLEAQAQAIFKSWFVDFEPFKNGKFIDSELGKIPEGWRVEKLGQILNIRYGKNLPQTKLKISGYPVYGANGQIGFYSEYMFKSPQVLVSCRGAASGKVNISTKNSFITNNSLILDYTTSKTLSFEYLKYYALRADFSPFVTGSAQPQITIETISSAKILVPNKQIMNKFNLTIFPILNAIFKNNEESCYLSQLRDTLLPKLMSGEIDVSDVAV